MSNKIKTIFFDLGNTLIHYHRGKLSDEEKDFLGLKQMYEFLKAFDNELSFTKLYEDFYLKWTEELQNRKFQNKEYDALQFLLAVLNKKFRNQITQEQIISAFKNFHEVTARFAECEKDLQTTLSFFKNKNIKLGIISNSPIPAYCHDETLKKLNLLQYFDKRFYSYDLNFKKPNKKIFIHALEQSNSKIEESLFVGDSVELDINPALNLKMKSIFFNSKELDINDEINYNKYFLGEIKYLVELKNKLSGLI